MFPFADGGYPEEDHTGLWVSVGVNGEKSSLKEPVLAATSSPLSITLEDHNLHLKHKVGLEQAAMPATQQCGEKLPAKGWLWPKMVNNTDPFFVPSASFRKSCLGAWAAATLCFPSWLFPTPREDRSIPASSPAPGVLGANHSSIPCPRPLPIATPRVRWKRKLLSKGTQPNRFPIFWFCT